VTTNSFTDENVIIAAQNGLRLIELHDKKHGEVYKHWEFIEPSPPTQFALYKNDIIEQQARIVVIDDKGNMHSSGPICDLDEMFTPSETSSKMLTALENSTNDAELEKTRTWSGKESTDNAVEETAFEQKANGVKMEGRKEQEKEEGISEKSDKERSEIDKKSEIEINLSNEKASHDIHQKEEQKFQPDHDSAGDAKNVSETTNEKRTVEENTVTAANKLAATEPHKITKRSRATNRCKEESVTRYY